MSTELSFKWEPGKLARLEVEKVEGGFVVEVWACNASGAEPYLRRYVCKSGGGVLELLAACFAWYTSEAAPADPVNPKFPSEFLRFDIDGAHVVALIDDPIGASTRFTIASLIGRIERLQRFGLAVDELGPWYAVLAELRARSAAAVAKEGAGA